MMRAVARMAMLAIMLIGAAPGLDAAPLPIRTDHPRLYFTRDDLPTLRRRCQTTHKAIFEALKRCADRRDEITEQATACMHVPAFLYQMTGDEKYARLAVELALKQDKAPPGDYSGVSPMALAYDWAYDVLSTDERHRLVQMMMTTSERRTTVEQLTLNTRVYHPEALGWVFHLPLAAYADGIEDAWATERMEVYRATLFDNQLPAINEVAFEGANDGYVHSDAQNVMHFVETWRVATGQNAFDTSPFLQGQPFFWLYRHMCAWPPTITSGSSDGCQMHGGNISGPDLALLAVRTNNPYTQTLAMRLFEEACAGGCSTWASRTFWRWIVWYDPDVAARSLSELPTGRLFRGGGKVFARQDWELTEESKGIHVGFWCGPSSTHANPCVNHFVLSRGQDQLVVRAGAYQNLTPHGSGYYHTSAGMNTLYINGMQELGDRRVDLEENSKRYPVAARCKYINGNVARYRGEIRRFVDRPRYTYVLGDGTYSYRLNGAKLFSRELVFLKAGALVVFDRVIAGAPGDPKRWQLHTYNEPALDGTVRVVEDMEEAGIVESADTSVVTAVEGDSKLFVVALLPKQRAVRRIGGEGYHSYVEGKNYHPLDFTDMKGPDWYKDLFTKRYRDGLPRTARAWHIEIEPRHASAEVAFLNVLYPCAKEQTDPPLIRLIENGALAGAELKLADRTIRVLFDTNGRDTGQIRILDATGRTAVDERLPMGIEQEPWPTGA